MNKTNIKAEKQKLVEIRLVLPIPVGGVSVGKTLDNMTVMPKPSYLRAQTNISKFSIMEPVFPDTVEFYGKFYRATTEMEQKGAIFSFYIPAEHAYNLCRAPWHVATTNVFRDYIKNHFHDKVTNPDTRESIYMITPRETVYGTRIADGPKEYTPFIIVYEESKTTDDKCISISLIISNGIFEKPDYYVRCNVLKEDNSYTYTVTEKM